MRIAKMARLFVLGVLLGAASTACDGANTIVAPVDATLSTQLETAIDDEYRAEAIYLRVLADFGTVLPFSNIVGAEERHSTALARLFANRGWDVPVNTWTVDNVPSFTTVTAACQAGVEAELANIEIYDQLLSETLPVDVMPVFTTNRRASLERHLPALQTCS